MIMKAIILAGGFATRLRPLSCTRPKILFPIGNKPMLQWTFERLARNRIQEVVMAVFHQTEFYIKQNHIPQQGLNITYSHDPFNKPLGTGGSIKKAEKKISDYEPFIVLNGDIFADVNYLELVRTHKQKKAIATIAVHAVEDPSRYGVVELDPDNRVKRFLEKPPAGTSTSNLINAGAYAFSPELLSYIPEGRKVSIEHEVFPKLVQEGRLYGYPFNGLWMDIGKPQDYVEINQKILDLKENLRELHLKRTINVTFPIAIDKKVLIGKGTSLGPYAIIGKNSTIGRNVIIRNTVIFPATSVSDECTIEGAIVGEGVTIEENVQIEKNCIIGDHATIKKNVFLAKGSKVCPASIVSENVLNPSML
jgi:NDP-sugar pyrophosphorylase family protein